MGTYPDVTTPATVPPSLGSSAFSMQTFEDGSLGDQVDAIVNWSMTGTSTDFSARFVSDALGLSGARPLSPSTQWLCIKDADSLGDNRVDGPTLEADSQSPRYEWEFFALLEQIPIQRRSRLDGST
jgi:hypothetical protein